MSSEIWVLVRKDGRGFPYLAADSLRTSRTFVESVCDAMTFPSHEAARLHCSPGVEVPRFVLAIWRADS